MKSSALLLLVLICGSCGPSDLPKYVELKGLRILGLIASQPEVDAGGSTTITPILSDITETTSLSFEAFGCISLTSVDTSCAGNPTATSLASGTLNSGDMTSSRNFTGTAASINVTVPAAPVIFAQRSSQDQFNGVTYLITYQIRNSAGAQVESFKRLIVSTRPSAEKNQNPALNDVFGNGTPFSNSLPAGQSLSIVPSFGSPAAETYRVQTDAGIDRPETEELITTWFVTDGTLKYYRSISTDSNTFDAPAAIPAGRDNAYLLAVTRDGRGGVALKRICFGTCL